MWDVILAYFFTGSLFVFVRRKEWDYAAVAAVLALAKFMQVAVP